MNFGSGSSPDLANSLIGAALASAFVILAGSLLKQKTDYVKVFFSCLAAIAGVLVALQLLGPTVFDLASRGGGSLDTKLQLGVVGILGLGAVVWLGLLSLCLALIAEIPKPLAFAMSLFSAGGMVISQCLYVLIRVGTLMPSDAKLYFYLGIGVGIVLMLIGYALGVAKSGQPDTTRREQPVAIMGAVLVPNIGADSPTVAAPSPAAAVSRPTESGIKTVVAESKNQVVSTAWLSVLVGPAKGTRFDLGGAEVRIGRGSTCAVKITGDDEIGREHALVRMENGRFVLHDLASKNFTFLNDNRVTDPRQLMNGDQIRVGKTILQFIQAGV